MMDLIKQYIKSLYNKYNGIIIDAPTGFGSHIYFSKEIIDDLLVNRKSCLVVSYLQLFSKQYYEDIFNYISGGTKIYMTRQRKHRSL